MKKLLLLSYFIIATAITTTAQCWQTLATGGGYSFGIKTNGTLWGWGFNSIGQLGDGTTTNRSTAVQTSTATNWKSIACGSGHSLAIKTDGTLWTWGQNTNGQLGDGTTVNKSVPTQIGVANNWLFVNAGENHSIAIKTDGTLWACGLNSNSQLGDGTAVDKNVFTQIGVATNWQSASGGSDFTMAIQSNGTLWGFGANSIRQLGDGTTLMRATPIQIGTATNWSVVACGQAHSVAVKTGGTLWSWGYNIEGALGSGAVAQNAAPTQIGVATNWKAVAAFYRHSLATKTDGTLWGFGYNNLSQLGDGTTVNRNVPTQIGVSTNWIYPSAGSFNGVAIKTDGTIWAWGSNGGGQLGDGTLVAKSTPVQVITTCAVGAALNLDGVDDYVSIGTVISPNSSYTKEAWIYANASSSGNIISSGSAAFWLSGGQLSTFNNGGSVIQDPLVFPLNQWVHVAVTFNSATSVSGLYKNGVLVNSGISNSGYTNDAIAIGQYGPSSSNFFQGSMDEVRIWDVARTTCEINTFMNCEIPTTATNLLANYHFNQGVASSVNTSITSLTDVSGNANNGALTNFALTGNASNWLAPGAVVSGFTTPLAAPAVNATVTNSVICNGGSTTLTGTGATTYTWTGGVTNAITFFPTTTVAYTVTGTAAFGCTNTAVKTITVNALPTVAVNSGTICSGNSFTIIPSGASTYTVQGGATTVSPLSNSTYTVKGTSAAGCVSANTATSSVTVNTTPTVAVNSGTICSGNSFTIIPTGAGTYTVQGGATTVSPLSTTSYTVKGTSTLGCVSANTATSSVTVNTTPTVSVNSGTICSGNSFTIIPTGASIYTVQGGATTVSPLSNTTYTVKGTSTLGCVSANTAVSSVTVNALPIISVNSGAICSGQSFTMVPSGASTYTYSSGTNVVMPTSNATYSVSGTDANGCVSSINVVSSVTVNTCTVAAAINFDGVDDYADIITPSAIPVGNSAYTIEAKIKPNTLGNLGIVGWGNYGTGGAVNALRLDASGNIVNYWWGPDLVVSSSPINLIDGNWHHIAATFDGTTRFIFIDGILKGSDTPGSAHIVPATNVRIGSTNYGEYFNGTIDEVRVWNVARTQCEINTYKDCEIPVISALLVANYHFNQGFDAANNSTEINVSDASGNSNTATLTNFALAGTTSNWIAPGSVVNGYTTALIPPAVNATVTNSVICNGNSTTLTGTGASTYTWTSGVTNATAFFPTTTTAYTVTGTAALTGCTNTSVKTITVNALPNVVVNSGAICNGQSFTMSPSGASTYTYSSGSAIVTPTGSTTYNVYGTDVNGCDNFATGSVTVNALPTIAVASTTICAGSTGSLTASGAATYTWNTGVNTPVLSASPASNTSYTVNGTSSAGCVGTPTIATITVGTAPSIALNSVSVCAGNSATLTASGVTTYTWNTGANTPTIIVTPTVNTTYSVNGNLTGCSAGATSTSTVTVNANPTVSVNSGAICTGQSFIMIPTGASTYTVQGGATTVSPLSNSTYTVKGTSAAGCVSANTATSSVTVNTLPVISVNSGVICAGQSFTMIPSGASTYTYSSGAGVVMPTANASYTVTGIDANGCNNTAVSSVTVKALPVVTAGTSNTLICIGQTATLSVTGATTYTWSTTETTPVIAVTPTTQTTYTVSGIDANGCTNSTTIMQDVSLCTGISMLTQPLEGTFIVYPNPASSVINIEFLSFNNETYQVELTDALGQLVLREIATTKNLALKTDSINNGIYFVKIISDNSQTTKRIILNR